MKNRKAILLTATVIPNSIYVTHDNIDRRLNEYYEALVFYLNELKEYDIYFLENSNYDFSNNERFQSLFKDKIKLLKFSPSSEFEKGKGYQEFEMLDRAVKLIENNYKAFIKITGRYKILNIKEIAQLHFENLLIDSHRKSKVSQTNLFCSSIYFYNKYLNGLFKMADDSKGVFIEHVVYNAIMKDANKHAIEMFPVNPLIQGVSGSYGTSLNRNKIKMFIRNLERKILTVLKLKEFIIEY